MSKVYFVLSNNISLASDECHDRENKYENVSFPILNYIPKSQNIDNMIGSMLKKNRNKNT